MTITQQSIKFTEYIQKTSVIFYVFLLSLTSIYPQDSYHGRDGSTGVRPLIRD